MKKLQHSLFGVFCMLALMVSFSRADDYPAIMQDGVKITVQIDPQGPNQWIRAAITFVNENKYRVEVTGLPIITCESGDKQEGVFVPFSMNPGETYWVTLAQYQTCGHGLIKNIDVEITVKKVSP